jgi:uncharacterized membrane protein
MSLALLLKLLHILTAIWLVTGLVGRYILLARAEKSRDIHEMASLLPVATIFERAMVIPASMAVFAAGLLTAWAGRWPILGFLQGRSPSWIIIAILLYLTTFPLIRFVFIPRGKIFEVALNEALAKDQVTPELTAAFRDPIVRRAHIYELAVVAAIISLMVLKPF